jgi:putative nucleotidyltransferase with HDIG domain
MRSVEKKNLQNLFYEVLSWHRSYAELYHSDNIDCQEHILLKQKHSIRVAGLSGAIARKLELSYEDIVLAKIIGLLHDIARFEQYTRYQTFNDKVSFDHGEFGVKIISKVPPLEAINSNLRAIIHCAVLHHNKIEIPLDLPTRERLHARLVRDADKLDIIYLTCKKIQNGSKFPPAFPVRNGKLSSEIIQAIARKQQMDYDMIQSLNDFHLLKIGWVYDLNFKPSLAIIKKRRNINIIQAALPASTELEKQFIHIDRYIEKQLNQSQPSECQG